jgi:hypothetical protein
MKHQKRKEGRGEREREREREREKKKKRIYGLTVRGLMLENILSEL